MKEDFELRIKRLRIRKRQLLDVIAGMGKYPNRFHNHEHKMALLNDEVMVIGERIIKLEG